MHQKVNKSANLVIVAWIVAAICLVLDFIINIPHLIVVRLGRRVLVLNIIFYWGGSRFVTIKKQCFRVAFSDLNQIK